MPLLTVCVPTSNRASQLEECLRSIAQAVRGHSDIEVLVADNASADTTPQLVEESRRSMPYLRYVRHSENLGPEANFYSCAEHAEGDLLWFIGDDDQVEPSAFLRILPLLTSNVNAIVVNYSVWTDQFKSCLQERFFTEADDARIPDRNVALEVFGASLGYLPTVIMRREAFLSVGRDRFLSFAPFGQSILYAAYAVISQTGLAYVATPLVRYRGDVSEPSDERIGWSSRDWDQVFIVGIHRVLRSLDVLGYSSKAITVARNRAVSQYVPARLRRMRRARANIWPTVRLLIVNLYDIVTLWTEAIPTMFLPRFVLRAAQAIRAHWRRRRRRPTSASQTGAFPGPRSQGEGSLGANDARSHL